MSDTKAGKPCPDATALHPGYLYIQSTAYLGVFSVAATSALGFFAAFFEEVHRLFHLPQYARITSNPPATAAMNPWSNMLPVPGSR